VKREACSALLVSANGGDGDGAAPADDFIAFADDLDDEGAVDVIGGDGGVPLLSILGEKDLNGLADHIDDAAVVVDDAFEFEAGRLVVGADGTSGEDDMEGPGGVFRQGHAQGIAGGGAFAEEFGGNVVVSCAFPLRGDP
jgi:hypothetical protein